MTKKVIYWNLVTFPIPYLLDTLHDTSGLLINIKYSELKLIEVSRSSKNLHEDNEYALYTVTLFNRDADNFRIKARERRFQIRDFECKSETQESRKQQFEKLMQDQESLNSSL